MLFLRILIGMLLGLCIKPCAFLYAKFLLQRRNKEFYPGKKYSLTFYLISALYGGLIGWLVPLSAKAIYLFLLLFLSETVSLTDLLYRLIPNDIVYEILGLTLVFGVPYLFGVSGFPEFSIGKALLGFAVCFIIFLLPSAFSKSVGAGDVKLAAAMGFSLGLWGGLIAIIGMGVLVLCLSFAQKSMPTIKYLKEMIPMGPFLAVALLTVWILTEVPFFQSLLQSFPF